VVQSTICLLAAIPATFVHALDFLVAPPGTLVLLRARDGDERVNGGERVAALITRQSGVSIDVRVYKNASNASTYWWGTGDVMRNHCRRSASRSRW